MNKKKKRETIEKNKWKDRKKMIKNDVKERKKERKKEVKEKKERKKERKQCGRVIGKWFALIWSKIIFEPRTLHAIRRECKKSAFVLSEMLENKRVNLFHLPVTSSRG